MFLLQINSVFYLLDDHIIYYHIQKKVLLAAKTSVSRQKLNSFQQKISNSLSTGTFKKMAALIKKSNLFLLPSEGKRGMKKHTYLIIFLKLSLYLSAHYIFRTNLLAARKFARGLLHTNVLWHLHHTFSRAVYIEKKTARKKENFHPSQFFFFSFRFALILFFFCFLMWGKCFFFCVEFGREGAGSNLYLANFGALQSVSNFRGICLIFFDLGWKREVGERYFKCGFLNIFNFGFLMPFLLLNIWEMNKFE